MADGAPAAPGARGRRAGVRVVICEDSRTYAHALRAFLETDGDFEVVRVCASAEELLGSLDELDSQLITMDLELPAMDGLRATREIMRRAPRPIVIISSHAGRGSERAAATLASGALEAVSKDDLHLDRPDSAASIAVRRRLRRLAFARSLRRPGDRPVGVATRSAARSGAARRGAGVAPAGSAEAPAVIAGTAQRRVSVIAVAASTGGPQALNVLLGDLPPDFRIPILVVQHMSAGFIGGLARWLDGAIGLPVGVAEAGMPAAPGVWLAPDRRHLVIDTDLNLSLEQEPASVHRPSADMLLQSMAGLGAAGAAVVLTGMGRDGAAGVAAMVAAGGLVIAEDASTAVVNGMPGAAMAAGAHLSVALPDLARALRRLRPAR